MGFWARFIFGLFLSLGCVLSTMAYASQYPTLSEAREKLAVAAYSSQEKKLLADQTLFFLENLFVHRDLKIKHFGTAVDPVPRLKALTSQYASMSDEEFHHTLAEIFSDLHDLHTNYYGAAPRSCGVGFIPVRFASITENGQPIVVAEGRLRIHPEVTEGISTGDELVSINGVAVNAVLKELQGWSGGANPDAIREQAVQLLSFRSFSSQPLPEEDSVTFQFKGRSGNYTKEIPWYVSLDEHCLQGERRRGLPIRHRLRFAEDDFQKRFNRLFGVRSLASLVSRSEDPISQVFEVAPLQTPAGTIGYIRLKAFYWEDDSLDLDVSTVVEALRRSIEQSLSEAVGLVIDVRGNPGGLIVLAEKMIQLFANREVFPTSVQMLANDLNEKIFLKANGGDNRWSLAIREAKKDNKKYTMPMVITPASEANELGQVWFRPVVVLTDATCYSACDLFAAGMQDMGAGVIVGLHNTTGAGGANVMEYDTFKAIMQGGPNPFKALPKNQNMRVSWRQTIRTGKNAGKLIEDDGIRSDLVVPLSRADVGFESKALMKQIHGIIDNLQPKYQSGLLAKRGGIVLLENRSPANWSESVWGADQLSVVIEGRVVKTIPLTATTSPKEVEIALPSGQSQWTDQRVTLLGKWGNKQVFRAVRELKWRGEYVSIPANGLTVDFNAGLGPMKTVLLRGNAGTGWQVISNKLRIGKGPHYEPGVLARAFLPVQLGERAHSLNIEFDLEAEDMHDTLRVYAINPDTGDRHDLYAGSEIGNKRSFSLPSDWERADLIFEFESDENWNMKGPEVSEISISN